MAKRKELGPSDWAFLTVLALAVFVLVRFVVAPSTTYGEPVPIAFDERVEAEADPFVADLVALRQVVEQRWAYLDLRQRTEGLDLKKLESTALAELGARPDEESFRRAVTRFVAALHDGHAGVQFAEHRLPAERHWPFTALIVAQGVMIDGVHPDAEGRLERGDLVRIVDGRPIEEHLDVLEREVCASSHGARRRWALERLTSWTSAREIELLVEHLGGERERLRVECPLIRLEIPRPGELATGREVRRLVGDIAYYRPGDFAPPEDSDWSGASPEERDEILAGSYAELEGTIAAFTGAPGLVLDLRGNPGGTDLLGQALVGHLVEPGFTYFQLSALRRGGWSDASSHDSSAARSDVRFTGPVICLIDEGTFSVADNVAACLRDVHPAVRFVGRPTGAGTGAPRTFTLPRTGTSVRFCTQRVLSPSGETIEGAGVVPDVLVVRSRESVLAGRDPAIDVALELLAD